MTTATFTLQAPREEDLAGIVVLNHAQALERGITPSPDWNEDQMRREFASPNFEIERQARVAVVDGKIVGRGTVFYDPADPQANGGGYVLPEYRGRGIGTELLRFQVEAARTLPGVTEYWSGTPAESPGAIALLEANGFERMRAWFQMIHRAPATIAAPEWPEGIEIRHFERAELVGHAVAAFNGSFIDHFNYSPSTHEDWDYWVAQDPKVDPELIHFAFRGEELAGFCCTYLEPVAGGGLRGDLGPIGTLRAFRGIGLGRALLRHGTRLLAERGAGEVELGVDSENPSGAVRLYVSNGYEQERQGYSYRIKL